METATADMVWGIIARLNGQDGEYLTPSAVARIYRIIDDCQPDNGPTGSQTSEAKWIAQRIERDEDAQP